MVSLLYKEYLVNRTVFLVYLAVAALNIFLFIKADDSLPIAQLLALFFTISAAAQEDRNNSHIFINSLPVSRKEVVKAKYIFSILFGLFIIGMTIIVQLAFRPFALGRGFMEVIIAIVAVCWFVAVFYPLYYWLGSRFVQIGMFVLSMLGFVFLPMLVNIGARHRFWGIVDLIQSFPYSLLAVLIFGFTGTVLLISLSLSVWLYGRKDF